MQIRSIWFLMSVLGLMGCVTSTSEERLEKQNKLLELELENKNHALASAKIEIDLLRDQIQRADDKLKDLTVSEDDNSRSLEEFKKNFTREQARYTQCQSMLEQVKDHLANGKFNTRIGRQEFIQTLSEWESQNKASTQTH
jgi:chromosome segregation ATPase